MITIKLAEPEEITCYDDAMAKMREWLAEHHREHGIELGVKYELEEVDVRLHTGGTKRTDGWYATFELPSILPAEEEDID